MLAFLNVRNRNMTENLDFYTYRSGRFKSKSSLADRDSAPKRNRFMQLRSQYFDLKSLDALNSG
jgi:hypothetical protein